MGFTGDFSGISLFSTKSSIIFNNHVFGNNPNPTTITRGFSINGSSNNKYCINDCNNSKEGFAIAGTCTSNNLLEVIIFKIMIVGYMFLIKVYWVYKNI